MPVTTFALLVLTVLALAGLTVWAIQAWGGVTVLAVLIVLGLAARWALSEAPQDEPNA